MERFILVALLISLFGCQSASAGLTVTLHNTEAKINDSTFLSCSTDILSKEIHWYHGSLDVYAGGSFYEPYLGRFKIEINNSTGTYNLIIPSVQPGDAGEYSCRDDGGHGKHSQAQLTVLADDPLCYSNINRDGLIGPNSCGIEPDELQLSCSVTYHGSIPPQMEWRKDGENVSIENVTSVKSGNNVTYFLSLKTDLSMNNQAYVCQTTKSATSQYQCNTETIKVQYVFSNVYNVNTTVGEEVNCFANSSQPCSYKWKWFKGEDTTTESNNQTLKPSKIGSHRCEASCALGKTSCTIVVMQAEVYATEAATETTSGTKLVFLAVLVVLVVLIIVLVCFILYRRHMNRMTKLSESQGGEESQMSLMTNTNQQTKNVDQLPSDEVDKDPKEDTEDKTLSALPLIHIDRQTENGNQVSTDDKEGGEQSQVPLMSKTNQQTNNMDQVPSDEVDKDPKDVVKGTLALLHTDTADPQLKETDQLKPRTDKVDENSQGLSLLEGKPELVSHIKRHSEETQIKGIAVLKNDVIIATENSPALEVYDVKSLEFLSRMPIPQLVNPFDIASCRLTECIFISDSKSDTEQKEIIRADYIYKLQPNRIVGKRWSTGDDCGSLSVFGESNIILCVSDKNKLIEYTSDGEKIREITMSGVVHPSHAIKLNSGDVVVSHGYKNDKLHQVCIVNQTREVVKSFGGERGTSSRLLNEPKSFVVDVNRVLVADSMNRRLLLLESNLEYIREFLTQNDGLLSPGKICLCEATHTLFVVDLEKAVLVFSFK